MRPAPHPCAALPALDLAEVVPAGSRTDDASPVKIRGTEWAPSCGAWAAPSGKGPLGALIGLWLCSQQAQTHCTVHQPLPPCHSRWSASLGCRNVLGTELEAGREEAASEVPGRSVCRWTAKQNQGQAAGRRRALGSRGQPLSQRPMLGPGSSPHGPPDPEEPRATQAGPGTGCAESPLACQDPSGHPRAGARPWRRTW